ncbi:hypothetical protein Goari_019747 [Gossypium aridum]|uniref:Uncharacterized protein n=1 Tax=Gossypium aridum TaxID=34290 RepID=A0A7J8WTN1_GOSAI|nr:hypothetical protein [Gossypium aridum]
MRPIDLRHMFELREITALRSFDYLNPEFSPMLFKVPSFTAPLPKQKLQIAKQKHTLGTFLFQVVSSVLVSSIAKAKSMVDKGKTSASKARLIILTLMRNKKAVLLGPISKKIHGFLGDRENDPQDDESKAIVPFQYNDDDDAQVADDDKYPDLTHYRFDEKELELEAEAESGSVIEMVKKSKEEGEDFSLEDEIDHVADLFITRFYKQMRLQKLLSFKRNQQMQEGNH